MSIDPEMKTHHACARFSISRLRRKGTDVKLMIGSATAGGPLFAALRTSADHLDRSR